MARLIIKKRSLCAGVRSRQGKFRSCVRPQKGHAVNHKVMHTWPASDTLCNDVFAFAAIMTHTPVAFEPRVCNYASKGVRSCLCCNTFSTSPIHRVMRIQRETCQARSDNTFSQRHKGFGTIFATTALAMPRLHIHNHEHQRRKIATSSRQWALRNKEEPLAGYALVQAHLVHLLAIAPTSIAAGAGQKGSLETPAASRFLAWPLCLEWAPSDLVGLLVVKGHHPCRNPGHLLAGLLTSARFWPAHPRGCSVSSGG